MYCIFAYFDMQCCDNNACHSVLVNTRTIVEQMIGLENLQRASLYIIHLNVSRPNGIRVGFETFF